MASRSVYASGSPRRALGIVMFTNPPSALEFAGFWKIMVSGWQTVPGAGRVPLAK